MKQVESEIERERRAAETVVEGMGPDMQQHYRALREESAHIEKASIVRPCKDFGTTIRYVAFKLE